MIVIIDNYDSFTYNLAQYLAEMGAELRIFRNDSITRDELAALAPDKVVISPGPGPPGQAGLSKEIIRELSGGTPILGVCLGHQCIAEVFGGVVEQAPHPVHGKTSEVYHDGGALYAGVTSPFTATRYHSLIVCAPLPRDLEVSAHTAAGEVMGLKHRRLPVHGVQFHPESVLTAAGKTILRNFLSLS